MTLENLEEQLKRDEERYSILLELLKKGAPFSSELSKLSATITQLKNSIAAYKKGPMSIGNTRSDDFDF